MVNVRVALPRSRLPESVEPKGLFVAVKTTLPARARVPAPVLTLFVEVAVSPTPPKVA